MVFPAALVQPRNVKAGGSRERPHARQLCNVSDIHQASSNRQRCVKSKTLGNSREPPAWHVFRPHSGWSKCRGMLRNAPKRRPSSFLCAFRGHSFDRLKLRRRLLKLKLRAESEMSRRGTQTQRKHRRLASHRLCAFVSSCEDFMFALPGPMA
jgi:hypothetical protein